MSRIKLESVEVGYGGPAIVSDFNYTIPKGKITTIIGANGCGKSTLLKAIARIIPYQKGGIYLDAINMAKENPKVLAKKITMLSQKMNPLEGLTVKELVGYGRYPYRKGLKGFDKEDEMAIAWAIAKTEIGEIENEDIGALSGGQLQRVWIAMALAQETDIILLDEPTTYLDMAHQLEILNLLKDLNEKDNRTIVMVLHDINQAARFSDCIIAMKAGQIIEEGSVERVMNKRVLKNVFNIDAYIDIDPLSGKPMCRSYECLPPKRNEKNIS